MLCAKRKLTGEIVTAYFASKAHGPFKCPDCGDEVILKTGRSTNHFAHVNPLAGLYAENESEEHRRCKMEIFLALQKEPNVRNVVLERPLGTNRPDVSATINGVPVAIEVQISALTGFQLEHHSGYHNSLERTIAGVGSCPKANASMQQLARSSHYLLRFLGCGISRAIRSSIFCNLCMISF
jgi:competence protein CoiA